MPKGNDVSITLRTKSQRYALGSHRDNMKNSRCNGSGARDINFLLLFLSQPEPVSAENSAATPQYEIWVTEVYLFAQRRNLLRT